MERKPHTKSFYIYTYVLTMTGREEKRLEEKILYAYYLYASILIFKFKFIEKKNYFRAFLQKIL